MILSSRCLGDRVVKNGDVFMGPLTVVYTFFSAYSCKRQRNKHYRDLTFVEFTGCCPIHLTPYKYVNFEISQKVTLSYYN